MNHIHLHKPIIPTLVSLLVVHNDHKGIEKDNNDGPLKPPAPPVEL